MPNLRVQVWLSNGNQVMLTGQVDLNIPGQDFEDIKDRNNKLLTKLSLLILLGFIGQICFGSKCGKLNR